MDMNSLADWSLGVKVVLCDVFVTRGWGGAYMPSFGMCAVVPTPQGGAYMPPFGMCAAIAHRGRCRHCASFADITIRRLRHPRQTWKAKVFAIPTGRTMPSLRVVRRHHKTTSAPPQES